MPTRIDVANQALSDLGTTTISAWDEDTRAARAVRRVWDQGRQFCLSAATWRFAATTAELALTPETPVPGMSYVHQLPADYLRPIAFRDEYGVIDLTISWRQFGSQLHSTLPRIWLEYVRDVADVESWPAPFIETFRTWLYAKLSGPLLGREIDEATMAQMMDPALSFAASMASLLDEPEPQTSTYWERARQGAW